MSFHTSILVLWPGGGLDGQGIGRNIIGRPVTRKRSVNRPLWWKETSMRIFVSRANALKGCLQQRSLIINWVGILFWDSNQFLSPSAFVITTWTHPMTKMEVVYGVSSMALHSPNLTWLSPLLSASSRDKHWFLYTAFSPRIISLLPGASWLH
jgi:hypothetical protein